MGAFLTPAIVTGIRQSAAGLFWDTCVIQRRTKPGSSGGYGHMDMQYGDYDGAHPELAIETSCNVEIQGVGEVADWSQQPEVQAVITFPASKEGDLSRLDRVQITKIMGAALAQPLKVEVVGPPTMDVLGLVANAKLLPSGAGNG